MFMSKIRNETTLKKLSDTPARLYFTLGEAEMKLKDIITSVRSNPVATKLHIDALYRTIERLRVSCDGDVLLRFIFLCRLLCSGLPCCLPSPILITSLCAPPPSLTW
jgi:hypothetical protein